MQFSIIRLRVRFTYTSPSPCSKQPRHKTKRAPEVSYTAIFRCAILLLLFVTFYYLSSCEDIMLCSNHRIFIKIRKLERNWALKLFGPKRSVKFNIEKLFWCSVFHLGSLLFYHIYRYIWVWLLTCAHFKSAHQVHPNPSILSHC